MNNIQGGRSSGKGGGRGFDLLDLFQSITSNIELEKLLEAVVPSLLEHTRSNCGAFYMANNATGKLELKYSTGFSKNIYSEFDLNIGEGLVGHAAMSKDISIISDLPDDSVFVTKTFLGKIKPKAVMLVPIINQEQLLGILAMSGLYKYTNAHIEVMNLSRYFFGSAIANSAVYGRSIRMASELTFQNKLIQDLNLDLERKMNEKTELLNSVLNNLEDSAVYTVGSDGSTLFWNKAAERLWGLRAHDVLGRDFVDVLSGGNNAKAAIIQYKFDLALKNGRYVEKGWRRRKDGVRFYAETSIIPVVSDYRGQIGLTGITADTTAQKLISDEKIIESDLCRVLANTAGHGVIVVDAKRVIKLANKPALDMTGAAELTGLEFYRLFEDETGVLEFIMSSDNENGTRKLFRLKDSGADITLLAPGQPLGFAEAGYYLIETEREKRL